MQLFSPNCENILVFFVHFFGYNAVNRCNPAKTPKPPDLACICNGLNYSTPCKVDYNISSLFFIIYSLVANDSTRNFEMSPVPM